MDLFDFVNSLFDKIKENGASGIYISMPQGMVKVDILPIDNKVYIRMNNDDMGYFEKVNNREITYYVFHQQYRVGIRNGLTANEDLMKNICEMNDLIDFHSA